MTEYSPNDTRRRQVRASQVVVVAAVILLVLGVSFFKQKIKVDMPEPSPVPSTTSSTVSLPTVSGPESTAQVPATIVVIPGQQGPAGAPGSNGQDGTAGAVVVTPAPTMVEPSTTTPEIAPTTTAPLLQPVCNLLLNLC